MASYILPFEKMHGAGNDFVMLHHKHLPENISEIELAKKLCDRHFGIGADGLIIARPATEGGDFAWSYLNSDGSYGEMCGNGIRCFARYLFDRGIAAENEFTVETAAGLITPEIQTDGQVRVNMGSPTYAEQYTETVQGYEFDRISMGNPHAIIWMDSAEAVESIDLPTIGPSIESDILFPEKTNVEFVYFDKGKQAIPFRVWERGSGITLACGTGACAAAVSAILRGLHSKDNPITIELPGGNLIIEWSSEDNNIYMTGPAQSVFIGQIELTL